VLDSLATSNNTNFIDKGLHDLSSESNSIMIIGESENTILLTSSIQSIGEFVRVIHVGKSEHAVQLLVEQKIPVIIIDYDANDNDGVEFSTVIRRLVPLSRIIMISRVYSKQILKDLINHGNVDVFLPLPLDDFSMYATILEQQAKFEINSMINQLVTIKPPKFSSSYFLLHDPKIAPKTNTNPKFLGMVITYMSIPKYMRFFEQFLNSDEYLVSGYLSAVSIMGSELFQEDKNFEEINLAGISIILHALDEIQFLFFYNNLNKYNFKPLEYKLNTTVSNIYNYIDYIETDRPIPTNIQQEISTLLTEMHEATVKTAKGFAKHEIVIYGNQLPKLNQILANNDDQYKVYRYRDKMEVLDHLVNGAPNVVIINQISGENTWNYDLAPNIKDLKPAVSIIALLKNDDVEILLSALNNEYIDFVLNYDDDENIFLKYLKKAAEQSHSIRLNSSLLSPHNLQYTVNHSSLVKTKLRNFTQMYQKISEPKVYGLFISKNESTFYKKFFPDEGLNINLNDTLLAGFISSLDLFVDEIFNNKKEFSGFKFGDVHLLIKKQYDYFFVFFIGNLDLSNYDLINYQVENFTWMMFDVIINWEYTNKLDKSSINFETLIEQLFEEFVHKCVFLSF
jgi:DNA-binding NarL/FixJ family response regulator